MGRVLIACEFSGVVRRAFRARGHDAFSCDLLPAEDSSPYHIQDDVRFFMGPHDWDLMIAHPPCTHLAVSGARWFKDKREEQEAALDFVRSLMAAPFRASLSRTRSASSPHAFASLTRSSSPGCSGMARPRPHACGSRTCRRWRPPTLSRAGKRGCIGCRLAPTAGKSAAGPLRASQQQWRGNGGR